METLRDSVVANLVSEFLIVVFGVLVANFVQRRIKQSRYGRWHRVLYPAEPLPDEVQLPSSEVAEAGSRPLFRREISPDTAQRILHDQSELDIYLKGRLSPFANVNCDLISELESGNSMVITKNDKNRRITIYARSPKISLRNSSSAEPRR